MRMQRYFLNPQMLIAVTYTNYSASLTAPDGVQNGVVVMYGEVPTNFDSCSVVVN